MRKFLLVFLMLNVGRCFAQTSNDTLVKDPLEEIVITATRTERKLGNIAIPVTLISQKQLKQTGALRLNEILQEQTGLFLSAGTGSNAVGGGIFGNGIQMQGLSPDYTLLLLDGEPLIGRQGGVMDLSRFAIGNIKKIEIVKGPSSSLYGSEAMAGVVNIITEDPKDNHIKASIRYGSFQTLDAVVNGAIGGKKTNLFYFFNRNSSNGYELDSKTPEKTLDPYRNYTGQIKFKHQFSDRTKLSLNLRYFGGKQESFYAINSPVINIGGNGITRDLNINPVLTHRISEKVNSSLRLYGSVYEYNQSLDSLKNNIAYYDDRFRQQFWRAENQTDIKLHASHLLTVGAGHTVQLVNTTRYRETKRQDLSYVFVQSDYKFSQKLNLISGARYDHNTDFRSRFSPKLALHWKYSNKLSFQFSYGAGFKAPDFRQLYLNFINNAAQGYTIYGASEFSVQALEQQKSQGLILQILPAAYQITQLNPEISQGWNGGFRYHHQNGLLVEGNLFYNRVRDLINYLPVAVQSNGTYVFSYVNQKKAFTYGGEWNVQVPLKKGFSVFAGYQLLFTGDSEVRTQIREGKIFGRDIPGGAARLMSLSDYGGLLNRSRHQANLRFFYELPSKGFSANLRFIYRSRWGVTDLDGNGFANMDKEYAKGFVQVNIAATKQIKKQVEVQAGINNLMNYFDPVNLPNIPGRQYFLTIHFSFHH
jgi:outer membrane receptor for ferrienterochelin and colicins